MCAGANKYLLYRIGKYRKFIAQSQRSNRKILKLRRDKNNKNTKKK